MTRRNRRPVVGPQQLHVAQLSPALRHIYAHRSKVAARREYLPVLGADRAAFSTANAAYRTQAQSVRAATNMTEQTLAQALRGLRGSGLQGSYLHQVLNELTARQGDAAAAVPSLLADAGAERAQAFQKARTQLIGDRAQMQQSAASKFNQLLKEADTSASSYLKAQSGGPGGILSPIGLKNADIALRDALTEWRANPTITRKKPDGTTEEVPLQTVNPLRTADQWRTMAVGLGKHYNGFGLAEAMAVIHRMIRKLHLQAAGPYRSQSTNPAIRSQATPYEQRTVPPRG